MTESVGLYKIDVQTGKLISILKFQGDFSKVDASLNQCVLSFDNTMIVTGGDDSIVRLFKLSKDMKTTSN